jgi:hypothetical protein
MIAEFSAKAAGVKKPDIKPVLKKLGITDKELEKALKDAEAETSDKIK